MKVRQDNQRKYGLSREEIKRMYVPVMATTHSLKDLLEWKKYFMKHKPPPLASLHKINTLLYDCKVFLNVLRGEGQVTSYP